MGQGGRGGGHSCHESRSRPCAFIRARGVFITDAVQNIDVMESLFARDYVCCSGGVRMLPAVPRPRHKEPFENSIQYH